MMNSIFSGFATFFSLLISSILNIEYAGVISPWIFLLLKRDVPIVRVALEIPTIEPVYPIKI